MYFLTEKKDALLSNERICRDVVLVWSHSGDNYYIALRGREGYPLYSGTKQQCKDALVELGALTRLRAFDVTDLTGE